MSLYKYRGLKDQEIRLLSLLPTPNLDDPIRIIIFHVPLATACESAIKKPQLEELKSTLPQDCSTGDKHDWSVAETPEGRTIYTFWDGSHTRRCTWEHPTLYENSITGDDSAISNSVPKLISYEALSYSWGSTVKCEIAYIELQETPHSCAIPSQVTMELRPNLASALKHLRDSDKPRTLWVDAICINQKDDLERNRQVSLMRDIYKYADRVVVWLGPSSKNCALAMSTLEYIGKQIECTRERIILPSPDCTEHNWHLLNAILPFNESVWQAIFDILSRSWFERVWIVQEIQLASSRSTIYCGEYQISWYLFRRAILCLTIAEGSKAVKAKAYSVKDLCHNLLGDSLPALVHYCTALKCSNPLDKVYGILGLAPPRIADKIHPNYELSVTHSYKSTFLNHVLEVHRLELLDQCYLSTRLVGCPSWVPNWFVPNTAFLLIDMTLASSGCSSAHWRYISPNTLEVLGVEYSRVRSVIQPEVGGLQKLLEFITEKGIENLQNLAYPTGESLIDAYAYTLYVGRLAEVFDGYVGYETLQEAKETILNMLFNYPKLDFNRSDVPSLAIGSRGFIVTENGYFGAAAEGTQPGKLC